MQPHNSNFNSQEESSNPMVRLRSVGLLQILKKSILLLCIALLVYTLLQEKVHSYPSDNIHYSAGNDLWNTVVNPLLILETKKKITIAIIDTGMDYKSSFSENFKYVKTKKTNLNDHGAKVAGIIAGQGKNYRGLLPGVKLISIKFGDTQSDINLLVDAIKTAIYYHPDIINISAGTRKDDPELHDVIKKGKEEGIIIIAAAGNTASTLCDYPAAYNEVLAVGSVDKNRRISSFSSTSEKIDVYAPGQKVKTIVGNSIVEFTGTSAATPFVSGLVAILKAIDPSLDFNAIKSILENSSDKSTQQYKNVNIINYANAIKIVQGVSFSYDKSKKSSIFCFMYYIIIRLFRDTF